MILFLNACIRSNSRTKRLADHLLNQLDGPIEEVRLNEIDFPVMKEEFLDWRQEMIEKGDFSDPYFDHPKQFAKADTIVIAAPYWDMSFPAMVKSYFEHINIVGLTFNYNDQGQAYSMCHAKRLFYVMSAGGDNCPEAYGFGYIKELAQYFYQIPESIYFSARGLDIVGADQEEILRQTKKEIDAFLTK